MKGEDTKLLIVAILAIVAIVLASFSIVFQEEEDDEDIEEEINSPPSAQISMETTTVEEFDIIYFNGSKSTDSDGIIIEYTWDFGDGKRDSGMYSNHIYSDFGTYTAILTAIDDMGDIDTDSIGITVTEREGEVGNQPPTANITVYSTSYEDDEWIFFNGSGSSDEDGVIVEYTWDFGDGIKDSGMYTNHWYEDTGTYTIILTVIDDKGGTDTDDFPLTLIEPAPVGVLDFTESSLTPRLYIGSFVSLSRSVSIADVSFTLMDDFSTESQDPIDPGSVLQITGGMNCTYHDTNENDKIDAGDIIRIYNATNDDEIVFIYKPTGEVIAQYTFIDTAPTGALDFTESTQTTGLYTGSFVSLSKAAFLSEVSLTITDDSTGNSQTQDPLNPETTLSTGPGGLNATYYDNNHNNKIDGGDTIRCYNVASGDQIKFIYKSTGGVIAQYTFVG